MSMLGIILLIVLALAILGGFSIGDRNFYGTGNYGGISLGTVLIIVLVLILMGRI